MEKGPSVLKCSLYVKINFWKFFGKFVFIVNIIYYEKSCKINGIGFNQYC